MAQSSFKNDINKPLNQGLYDNASSGGGGLMDFLGGGGSGGSLGPGIVSGIAEMAVPYAEAISRDYTQELTPLNYTDGRRVNIGQISGQEYTRDPFAYGDILRGVKTGASAGMMAGPQGALIGAAAGGLIGAGSAVIKRVKDNNARDDFQRRRARRLEGAYRNNSSVDFRRSVMEDQYNGLRSQYAGFYGR